MSYAQESAAVTAHHQPAQGYGMCCVRGCMLPGSIADSTTGSADWFCHLHHGASYAEQGGITARMNDISLELEAFEPLAGTALSPSIARAHVSRGIVLTLPYPISANRYWASRTVTPRGKGAFTSTYVTPEAKAYKAQVQKLALVAGVRKPIAGRVRVEFTLFPNRPQDWQKRMRKEGAAWDDTVQCLDLDNAQKVVLDSLKGVVFEDDRWVREISARRAEPDEFGARLMAVVTPLAVEQPQAGLFGAVAQERKA